MGHLFWQNTFYTTTPDIAVDLLVQCIHCWHTATIRAGDHYQSWLHPCFHWSDPQALLWFRWYNRGNQQISKKDSSKLRNPAWTDNWNSLLQTVGLFFFILFKRWSLRLFFSKPPDVCWWPICRPPMLPMSFIYQQSYLTLICLPPP